MVMTLDPITAHPNTLFEISQRNDDSTWKKSQLASLMSPAAAVMMKCPAPPAAPAPLDPRRLIHDALAARVNSVDHESCLPGEEDAFYVADLGEVYRQHMRWKRHLSRVKPFFAVKSNPDPQVLRLLAELGTGFDCASKNEVEQVLHLGLHPDRIIYAQPCKTNSYVRYVRSVGVRRMTFDNADELYKIAKLYPDAQLVLRILTDDKASLCRFSMKFGAALDATDNLLSVAKSLNLNLVGVSFHVGSGASDPLAFVKAVRDAHVVFQHARSYGFEMQILDLGGGFCTDTFDGMAAVLCSALDQYFPSHCGVSIIAEPGRFYVATAFTLACNVIARRTVDRPGPHNKSYMIYVNDGVYGNFSGIMFDHQNPEGRILRIAGHILYDQLDARPCPPSDGLEYSIWGPTCDGIDRITASTHFAAHLDVGDWLYFENMGAYTNASVSKFNGFTVDHDVLYVCSEYGARALLGI